MPKLNNLKSLSSLFRSSTKPTPAAACQEHAVVSGGWRSPDLLLPSSDSKGIETDAISLKLWRRIDRLPSSSLETRETRSLLLTQHNRTAYLATASSSSHARDTATTCAAVKTLPPAVDEGLKNYISSLDASSASTSGKRTLVEHPQPSEPPSPSGLSSLVSSVDTSSFSGFEDPTRRVSRDISSILCDGSPVDSEGDNGGKPSEDAVEVPWFSNLSNFRLSSRQKDKSRERKHFFKNSQVNHVNSIVGSCAVRLGTVATLDVFGKLGRETSIKEFNALLRICIESASIADDETVALEQVSRAFEIIMSMKERGFPVEDESYGQVLLYLIDRGMVEQFHLFTDVIKNGSATTLARLGYYEMLLYTRLNDDEKVQEFCNCIFTSDGDETINLRENYLLALCDSDHKDYLLRLLETVDITQISSLGNIDSVFQSLGRLSLQSHAEKFLLALKGHDVEPENISGLIFSYATSIPNLTVEDVLIRIKNLHRGIEMTPSSTLYAKLVMYSCDLLEVHVAFDLVDQMCKAGLSVSMDIIHSLLKAIEESADFNLVERIYSLIRNYDLRPDVKTFRDLILLSVKSDDFAGAYAMLNDSKKLNLKRTASMYNAIIGGYFRQKNVISALRVYEQMKLDEVEPDSSTYGYLIGNCDSEEKVTEYYEELKASRVQVTKQVFMALINAFSNCGQFEKAKQVLLDEGIPVKYFNEIKSVLVSALASNGEMADALDIYDEIKEAGHNLEPRAAVCLIEHLQSTGELSRVLQLLEELHDPRYFMDGCVRATVYCVRNKHLRHAVDLVKRLNDRFCNDESAMDAILDEVFSHIPDLEPGHLQIGLDLFQAIKDELGVIPSRKSLDYLLSACGQAKDRPNSLRIWKEYEAAGLPYNVLNYLRMYQALLSCQDSALAKSILEKIPRDDPHVRMLIEAFQKTYIQSNSTKQGKKKKKK